MFYECVTEEHLKLIGHSGLNLLWVKAPKLSEDSFQTGR